MNLKRVEDKVEARARNHVHTIGGRPYKQPAYYLDRQLSWQFSIIPLDGGELKRHSDRQYQPAMIEYGRISAGGTKRESQIALFHLQNATTCGQNVCEITTDFLQ